MPERFLFIHGMKDFLDTIRDSYIKDGIQTSFVNKYDTIDVIIDIENMNTKGKTQLILLVIKMYHIVFILFRIMLRIKLFYY